MATPGIIKSVKKKYAVRKSSGKLVGSQLIRNYREVWVVLAVDEKKISEQDISNDPEIPPRYKGYPGDSASVCIHQEFEELDGERAWLVTCHYSNQHDDPSNDGQQDLTGHVWKWSGATIPYQKYLPGIDLDKKPFVNSAGQAYDQTLMAVDDSRESLVLTRIEAASPAAKARAYKDSVNVDAVRMNGVDYVIGEVKLAGIRYNDFWQEFTHFWNVSYEFHIDDNGWLREVADQGINSYEDPADGSERGAEGEEVYLDGHGRMIAKSLLKANPPNPPYDTSLHNRKFRVYKKRHFGNLIHGTPIPT